MIRTAIIYKIIDTCIDRVFDRVLGQLENPVIDSEESKLKVGDLFPVLTVAYSNVYTQYLNGRIISLATIFGKRQATISYSHKIFTQLNNLNPEEYADSLRRSLSEDTYKLLVSWDVKVLAGGSVVMTTFYNRKVYTTINTGHIVWAETTKL